MDTDEVERRAYDRYEEGDPRGGQFAPANKSGMIGSFDTSRPSSSKKSQAAAAKAKETPTAPRASSQFKTLAPDEDNDPQAVAEMQQLLTALGLGNLSSGEYDDATVEAVKEVQRRLGVKKPNGKASKALINKMLNAYDLSPCIKRSENPDGDEVERGRPYPGQKYRHGWILMSPVAVLPADAVDDEYGEELDSVDFGEASRIVAREQGVTVESEQGDDIAIHAAPSLEDAERWADLIDSGETYSRQRFGHEPYDGGASVRFGDLETDVDNPEDVAQALRDMAYAVEDHQNPPDDDIDEEADGDETPIADDSRAARGVLRGRPYPGQRYKHGWIPVAVDPRKVDEAQNSLVAAATRDEGRAVVADMPVKDLLVLARRLQVDDAGLAGPALREALVEATVGVRLNARRGDGDPVAEIPPNGDPRPPHLRKYPMRNPGFKGQTYWRVQSADRDPDDLLEPDHVSYSWDSEDVFDQGTSTTRTPEELAEYLAQVGIPIGLGDWVLVEVAGEDLGPGRDRMVDERLVQVDQIVSVRPLDDEFFGMVGDAWDRQQELLPEGARA